MKIKELIEAQYPGNMGATEMFFFYNRASEDKIALMNKLIKQKKFREAWKLMEKTLGIKMGDPYAKYDPSKIDKGVEKYR